MTERKSNELPDEIFPNFITKPAQFIRENFVLPFRPKEPPVYYHRRYNRVPTIDQCEVGDVTCRFEANEQFLRDKAVDMAIVKILTRRLTQCHVYWGAGAIRNCQKEKEDKDKAMINYAIKYGDIGYTVDVLEYYMKQKHRMIWLRRRQENGDVNASYTD
ncbi:mitochondrial respiratory chain complex I assembly [Mactra antiquata]